MSKNKSYESKAQISTIKATSRMSIKVKESFFTVEYCEERTIPQVEGVDIEEERYMLWDKVNSETDKQIDEIIDSFAKQ